MDDELEAQSTIPDKIFDLACEWAKQLISLSIAALGLVAIYLPNIRGGSKVAILTGATLLALSVITGLFTIGGLVSVLNKAGPNDNPVYDRRIGVSAVAQLLLFICGSVTIFCSYASHSNRSVRLSEYDKILTLSTQFSNARVRKAGAIMPFSESAGREYYKSCLSMSIVYIKNTGVECSKENINMVCDALYVYTFSSAISHGSKRMTRQDVLLAAKTVGKLIETNAE